SVHSPGIIGQQITVWLKKHARGAGFDRMGNLSARGRVPKPHAVVTGGSEHAAVGTEVDPIDDAAKVAVKRSATAPRTDAAQLDLVTIDPGTGHAVIDAKTDPATEWMLDEMLAGANIPYSRGAVEALAYQQVAGVVELD